MSTYRRPPVVVALPAYNEVARGRARVAQTRPVDRPVVAPDNRSNDTAAITGRAATEVWHRPHPTPHRQGRHRRPARERQRGAGRRDAGHSVRRNAAAARGSATVPGRLIVLVPAHNEAQGISEAVTALLRQTYQPTQVVVIADNCRDETARLAAQAGARVFTTYENRHKKAGALNQALAQLLPRLASDDFVMVVDADSVLDPHFLTHAVAKLSADRRLGAVGGVFRGSSGSGFVGHLQRNEYMRYARDLARLNGKCLVVTGTAAVFRAGTLKEISAARLSGKLPTGDRVGGVYDTTVLTEDNEMTFALRHLGYTVLSPKECSLVTEVMGTWGDLWRQRLRWKRGAVENCFQYGLTRVTWRYWGRQLMTLLGVLVTFAYLGSLVYTVVAYGGIHIQPFWLAISSIFVVERVVTVRYRGWKYMLASATMYELVLDLFLQFVHAKAYADAILRRERNW
ncbi:glycosyltransferase family 2 protein [Micromonospora sp. NPDC047740]|uniref:glycosyltransferase family 2 protein n=1 Tax=Micromonospora sp. NPDC047740 TaxID=3364254 RepID=UPI003716FF45